MVTNTKHTKTTPKYWNCPLHIYTQYTFTLSVGAHFVKAVYPFKHTINIMGLHCLVRRFRRFLTELSTICYDSVYVAVMGQFRDKRTKAHIPNVVRRHVKTLRITLPADELSDDSVPFALFPCKVFF